MQQQVNAVTAAVPQDDTIEQLKSFCRGEMSAVETYRQAIEATHETWIVAELRRNLASHENRVAMLSLRIAELGGDPPESSGPWGTFAKAAEGAAAAFGEKSALAVLEQGEDHGLNDYRSDLGNLDRESHRLVRDRILPEQLQTHRTLSQLKHRLA
jgi:hypothetical protein